MTALRAIYLLALVLWVGSILFFSFVGAPAIFKTLPREQAGDVVGTIFPKYYAIGTICGLAALGSLFALSRGGRVPLVAACVLVAMIGVNLYAQVVVQKQVQAVKAQLRIVQGGGEDVKPVRERFSRLHAFSMILNLIVLSGGLFVIVWTASSLTF